MDKDKDKEQFPATLVKEIQTPTRRRVLQTAAAALRGHAPMLKAEVFAEPLRSDTAVKAVIRAHHILHAMYVAARQKVEVPEDIKREFGRHGSIGGEVWFDADKSFEYIAKDGISYINGNQEMRSLWKSAYTHARDTPAYYNELGAADKQTILKAIGEFGDDIKSESVEAGLDEISMRNLAGFALNIYRSDMNGSDITMSPHSTLIDGADPQQITPEDVWQHLKFMARGLGKPAEEYSREYLAKKLIEEQCWRTDHVSRETFDKLNLKEFFGDEFPQFNNYEAYSAKANRAHAAYKAEKRTNQRRQLNLSLEEAPCDIVRLAEGEASFGAEASYHLLAHDKKDLDHIVNQINGYLREYIYGWKGATPVPVRPTFSVQYGYERPLEDDFSFNRKPNPLCEFTIIDPPPALARILDRAIKAKSTQNEARSL